jgi:hypothetical protein
LSERAGRSDPKEQKGMQVVTAILAEAFSLCAGHADGATDGPALSGERVAWERRRGLLAMM